ncbi:MAG: alanine racemase [Treponema sp.]|jgi:alanine racemase|nr:alanine racemase [Treponema sp.]
MRARAIIHLDNFLQNVAFVKKLTGKPICVPVKTDAYGHGAVEIAKAALNAGVSCLGVAAAAEGTELRKNGISCPILLFSQPNPNEIPEIFDSNLTPFISDFGFVDALNKYAAAKNTKISVHIKIDTGMGRLGCSPEEALPLAKHIRNCPALNLAGVATHFAASDSFKKDDKTFTQLQISRFKDAVQAIRDAGIDPGIVHAANSGAVLLHPDSWFDMVRPGILLYGYAIAEEDKPEYYSQIKPVMELRAAVSLIKPIKKGVSVSYDRIWTAPNDTDIAVLSIGYGDGLPRLASNRWAAMINGKAYSLAGRICMDQCCVDIEQDKTVSQWDEAVIFGGLAQDAATLAQVIGTIPYEITCNINKRVERIYIGN